MAIFSDVGGGGLDSGLTFDWRVRVQNINNPKQKARSKHKAL